MRSVLRAAAWLTVSAFLSILVYWPLTLRAQTVGGGGGGSTVNGLTGGSLTGGLILNTLATPVNGSLVDDGGGHGGALLDSNQYGYRVTATNLGGLGETAASTETLVTTSAGTGSSDHKITVNWTAITGATGYNVYRSVTPPGGEVKITASIGTTGTSYVDTGSAASGTPPATNTTSLIVAGSGPTLLGSSGQTVQLTPGAIAGAGIQSERGQCFPSTGVTTGAPFGQTLFTNASTLTSPGTNVVPNGALGVGGGNYVAKACSDGVTCGAGNIYVTYTAACTDALNASDVVSGTLNKSAVPANTTMTWNVTTACTSDSFNVCFHATIP